MKRFTFLIRVLTLGAWFLPFVFFMSTCVGSEYKSAYTKQEAYENIRLANLEMLKEFEKTADELRSQTSAENSRQRIDSFRLKMYDRLYAPFNQEQTVVTYDEEGKEKWEWQNAVLNILIPNYYSLSGFGTLMEYKNTAGRLFSAGALFLSVILLALWRFLKRKNRLLLLSLNLCFALAMLVNGMAMQVDLLYGFWIFFTLVVTQLCAELFFSKERTITSP